MQQEQLLDVNQVFKDDHDDIDPNSAQNKNQKLQYLSKLPPPNFVQNLDLEHAIRVSIDLSLKKGNEVNEEYFVSKTLKNFKEKKENQLTDDAIWAMIKKYDLDEYSTNQGIDIFNPKKIMDELLEIDDQKKKSLQYQQTKKIGGYNQPLKNFYSRYQSSQLK